MPRTIVTTRQVSLETSPKLYELMAAITRLIVSSDSLEEAAGFVVTNVCSALGFNPQTAEARLAEVTGDTHVIRYLNDLAATVKEHN